MDSAQITTLLQHASEGDKDASDRLIRVVYADLHRLASRYLSGERAGHILQTTALVNETYFRLFGGEPLNLAPHADRLVALDSHRERRNQPTDELRGKGGRGLGRSRVRHGIMERGVLGRPFGALGRLAAVQCQIVNFMPAM